jgi:hypothetical protein
LSSRASGKDKERAMRVARRFGSLAGVAAIAAGGAAAVALTIGAWGASASAPAKGTLAYTATGPDASHRVSLQRQGSDLQLVDTDTGRLLGQRPAADTGSVVVQGTDGNVDDTFTLDLPETSLHLPGGIRFDGGQGGFDTLVLQGGRVTKEVAHAYNAHSGWISLDSLKLHYANIEPIVDTTPAATITVTGTALTETINVVDGPSAGGPSCPSSCATTEVNSTGSTFERVIFANKGTLVIDGGGGADTVSFDNPNPATGLTTVVTQSVTTVTQASALKYNSMALGATGSVTLTDAANDIATLAANTDGPLAFVNTNPLTVGTAATTAGITTSNDDVTIAADELNVADVINAGSAKVLLQPRVAGRPVSLGAETAGQLSLTDAELDRVTAGVLEIGNATAGFISFTGAISPGGTNHLSLVTNEQIVDNFAGTEVAVSALELHAQTGIGVSGSFGTMDTAVSNLETQNVTGGTKIVDLGALTIGGVTPNLSGAEEVTSGDLEISAQDTLSLDDTDGSQMVKGGSTSGNVKLTSDSGDVVAVADRDAVTVPKGDVTITAAQDVLLGTVGFDHDNDVRASGNVLLSAIRDVTIDGFADMVADDFGQATGGTLRMEAGRDVNIPTAHGSDASAGASGAGFAKVVTGAGGFFRQDVPFAGLYSNGGDVIINADRMAISAGSVQAGQLLTVVPVSAPTWQVDLGSTTDAAASTLEVSSAELQRLDAPVVRVGDAGVTPITVSAPVTAAANRTLSLRASTLTDANVSGTDITASALALRANGGMSLTTNTSTLAFESTGAAGNVSITNTAPVSVDALDGIGVSTNAGSFTTITAVGLNVTSGITGAGAVALLATDDSGPDNDISITSSAVVQATGGNMTLTAGDQVLVPAGATLFALTAISIDVDQGSADPGTGAVVTIDGTLTATGVDVTGGSDSDTFTIKPQTGPGFNVIGANPVPPASPGDSLLVRMTGATTPALSSSTDATGTSGTWSFGNRSSVGFSQIETLANLSTITGTVTNDQNGNGGVDVGDDPLSGWTVELRDTADNVLSTTPTNGSGAYTFTVIPGAYRVRLQVPSGWVQTSGNPSDTTAPETGTNLQGGDFALFQTVTIGGTVFDDVDGGGTQDLGDSGIDNRTVFLDDNDNGILDSGESSTTTAGGGTYHFTGVGPGTYKVRTEVPSGWVQTTSQPADITTVSGSGVGGVDFGTFQLVTIDGTVWNDVNGNGTRQGGDAGLGGWTVFIDDNHNGSLDSGEGSVTTANDGTYSFTDVPPGTYTLRQVSPTGWTRTTGNPADITTASGNDVSGVDFGNFKRITLSGLVFQDFDNNGAFNDSDRPQAGWTVFLDNNGNGTKDSGEPSVLTGADGAYAFADRGPGTVKVAVVPNAGWTTTPSSKSVATASGTDVAQSFANFRTGFAGYAMVGADGDVFNFGGATLQGSLAGKPLAGPIVGIAYTPSGNGYWLAASDGGVFAFGDAAYLGSLGGIKLNAPVVGIQVTPSGKGYWLVASDGGVFTFGDAPFFGSLGGIKLNAPVVGIASTSDGSGYFLAAQDGGVFSFGKAAFAGSGLGTVRAAVYAIATDPVHGGYWLAAKDGGVFSYGGARFFGSLVGTGVKSGLATLVPSATGNGYWIFGTDGGVFAFGDAPFMGAVPPQKLKAPVVGGARPR